MEYKVTVRQLATYKGWSIDIAKKYLMGGNQLLSKISPAIQYNNDTPLLIKNKIDAKIKEMTYSVTTKKRYFGIFEFDTPWNEALQDAKNYIDFNLGEITVDGFLKKL
jgi:hypothetical protein